MSYTNLPQLTNKYKGHVAWHTLYKTVSIYENMKYNSVGLIPNDDKVRKTQIKKPSWKPLTK